MTDMKSRIQNGYHDLSTTYFKIHPNSNLSISFKDHLPIRPISFSANRNNSCQGHQLKDQNLTFKPFINDLPFQIYSTSERYNLSKEDRFERLIKDNRDKQQQVERFKRLQSQKQLQRCTFQPNQSKIQYDNMTQQVFDRLYQNSIQKLRKESLSKNQTLRQYKINDITQNQNIKSPHKYLLNSQKHNLNPLYLRLKQVITTKIQQRKKLSEKYQQFHSFHPQINPCIRQKSSMPIVQRLMQQIQKRRKNKEKLIQKYQQIQNQKLTFKPIINNYIPFDKNINQYQLDNQTTCFSIQKQSQQVFHPKINKLSQLIVKQNRGHQNQQQRINRLYYDNAGKKMQKLYKLQEQIYHECTFNPQINIISKQINANHITHCCKPQNHVNYSFMPKINQCSRLLSKNRNPELSEKKQALKMTFYKNNQQYQMMKQCKFRPTINQKILKSQRSIKQVEGMNIFINKIQRMNQNIKKQKQFQEKIFNLQKKYDNRMNKRKHSLKQH